MRNSLELIEMPWILTDAAGKFSPLVRGRSRMPETQVGQWGV